MNAGRKFLTLGVVAILTIATVALLGFWHVVGAINGFYHPNAVKGDYGSAYLGAFELAVLLNWLYLIYAVIRGAAEKKLRITGICWAIFISLIAAFYAASLIPRNYHAEYYISQEKYSIPWQYNPLDGSSTPNGKCFEVHVSYPDFSGKYSAEDYLEARMVLAKCIFGEKDKFGTPLDDVCFGDPCGGLSNASPRYFVESGFIYRINYQGDNNVSFRDNGELTDFKKSVVDLFDSFRTE